MGEGLRLDLHASLVVAAVSSDACGARAAWPFEDRISVDVMIELWERAAALTGRRDLPALAAQYAVHDERSLLAFLVSNQANFGAAIDRFVRYFPTVGDGYAWRVIEQDDTIRIAAIPPGPIHRAGWQLHVEFELIDSVRSAAAVRSRHRATAS
jgi:hypothetical protein